MPHWWETREGFSVEEVYLDGPNLIIFSAKIEGGNMGRWNGWLRIHSSTCWTLLKGQGVSFA